MAAPHGGFGSRELETRQQFYQPIAVAATHGESQSLGVLKVLHTLDLKTPRVTDAGIGVLSGLCHFTLYYNNHVTLAGITELIRHSPNLWHLFTLRCGNLEHDRTQARIADLIDSNLNKQRGLAEVITAS